MKQLLATLGFLLAFLMANAADYSKSLWVDETYTFSFERVYYYPDANSYCYFWSDITFDNPSPDYLSIEYYIPLMAGNITLTVKVKKVFSGTKTITMNYIDKSGYPSIGMTSLSCSKTFAISCKKVYVTLEPTEIELEIGETKQLSYSFHTSASGTWNPSPTIQSFSTSDSQVAKVNASGLVTAVGAGQATITAKTNYYTTDQCVVTVPAILVSGISLNTSSMTLLIGSSRRLSATVAPSNATNNKVTWSSSNPAVLTIDQNGNIKAIKAGVATITASSSDGTNLSASCKVTVYEGDVDGDNAIDIVDVSALIDAILNLSNK